MTLVFILVAVGLDYLLGSLEPYRRFSWITGLYYLLERKLDHLKYWDGTPGLVCLLSVAILGLIAALFLLAEWSWLLEFALILAGLIYCLAPEQLDNRLDHYISAIERGDTETVNQLVAEITGSRQAMSTDDAEVAIIKSALIESHKKTFAVIFWFLLLGIVGALLYRIVTVLDDEFGDVRSGFSEALNRLLNILEWPSSRLYVVSLGLAGSLMHAFPGWKEAPHFSLAGNDEMLVKAGEGALQYRPSIEFSDNLKSYWISELKSLINRTLIIWLAVIAVMTLSGALG